MAFSENLDFKRATYFGKSFICSLFKLDLDFFKGAMEKIIVDHIVFDISHFLNMILGHI